MSIDMIKKTYRNPSLLRLAKGHACVCCGIDDGTIVAAHSNTGKGMGIKSSDATIMFLCKMCHYEYDSGKAMTKEERRQFAFEHNAKTLRILIEEGNLYVRNP